jgi:hypothetical protein
VLDAGYLAGCAAVAERGRGAKAKAAARTEAAAKKDATTRDRAEG